MASYVIRYTDAIVRLLARVKGFLLPVDDLHQGRDDFDQISARSYLPSRDFSRLDERHVAVVLKILPRKAGGKPPLAGRDVIFVRRVARSHDSYVEHREHVDELFIPRRGVAKEMTYEKVGAIFDIPEVVVVDLNEGPKSHD